MPDNDVERASALAEQATHASVTAERLIENRIGFQRYRLSQEPLYRRLKQGEQPHFLFHADKEVPKFNGPAAPDGIRSSLRHRVMHLVTGQRWLMIAGHRDGDQEREIALGAIGATNFETDGRLPTALSNNLFVFEIEGAHITVPLANEYDADDLEDLSRYLRDEVGATRGGVAVDSDEAGYTVAGQDAIEYDARDVRNRLDQLPADVREEASTHVRTADSAEELIPYLDDLIADHEEPGRTLDEVIGEATSVEELRREVATPTENARRRAQDRVGQGVDEVRQTVQDADPQEAGRYAIGVGRAAYPLARRAPAPTLPLLVGALATGATAGIHASGRENSPLAELDPEALATHVTALTQEGKELEHIDGAVAGTLLGILRYTGEELLDETYAHWITEADPEAIMAGADAGAAFAAEAANAGTPRQGAVAGAGLGLVGSYIDWDDDEFRATVDADIYKDYLEALAQEGLVDGE